MDNIQLSIRIMTSAVEFSHLAVFSVTSCSGHIPLEPLILTQVCLQRFQANPVLYLLTVVRTYR